MDGNSTIVVFINSNRTHLAFYDQLLNNAKRKQNKVLRAYRTKFFTVMMANQLLCLRSKQEYGNNWQTFLQNIFVMTRGCGLEC